MSGAMMLRWAMREMDRNPHLAVTLQPDLPHWVEWHRTGCWGPPPPAWMEPGFQRFAGRVAETIEQIQPEGQA
jgi:hypothetical protein